MALLERPADETFHGGRSRLVDGKKLTDRLTIMIAASNSGMMKSSGGIVCFNQLKV
jgi:hypothetical protein